MNAVEYIQKEQDGLQAQLDYYRKEIARKTEVVEHQIGRGRVGKEC